MVRVDSMQLAVRIVPLLEGRIEVTAIVLNKPEIALEVARDGTANWTVVRTKTEESGIRLPKNATFGTITIRDGHVTYDNDKLGVHRAVGNVNAHVALSTSGAPLDIASGFDHHKSAVSKVTRDPQSDNHIIVRDEYGVGAGGGFLHEGQSRTSKKQCQRRLPVPFAPR